MCHAKCEGTGSPPQYNYDTDDGTYDGNWKCRDNWNPDVEHNFIVDSRNVIIKIKLMEFDGFWEGGSDDLADVSGSDHPDCDGVDDGTPNKRGAIYHGTYDLVTGDLKDYDPDPDEYADFVYKDQGYYLSAGDYEPDLSTEYENGMSDPQNDALVYFRLLTDYKEPQAIATVITPPDKTRPYEDIQFAGVVYHGTPTYSWYWEFGDGETSNEQNPTHIYYEEGLYTVKFTVTDGFDQVSSHSVIIDVKNDNPILSNDKVEWHGGGGLGDTFTFSVHYIDPDLDIPTVKSVFIDNEERTLNGEGSNSIYSLSLKGSDMGEGKHKFYFYFEDGHGGSAITSEKSFTVKRSKSVQNFRFVFLEHLFNYFPILKKILQRLDI